MKELIKLTPEVKKSIADKMLNQNSTDQAIIAEYGQSYILDTQTLQEIRKSIERSSNATHIKSPEAVLDAMQNGQTLLDELKVISGQYEIKKPDGTTDSLAFGPKILGEDENITNKTQIGIGSVTKLFTAVALFNIIDKEKQAVANQTVSADQENFKDGLDTKLSNFMDKLSTKYPDCQYLQEIQKMPHYQDISLRNLLEHSAGLHGRDDGGLAIKQLQGAPMPNSEVILDHRSEQQGEFGKYKYNNLGYELLGMVMSVATGKSFDEVVKDAVIDPYELKHTSLKTQPSLDIAEGRFHINEFTHDDKKIPAQYMDFTTNGNSVAAGGLLSTAEEMAKFMQKTFAAGTFQSDYMKSEIKKMRDGEGGTTELDGNKSICGFKRNQDGVLFHLGDNAVSKAGAFIDKEDKVSTYAVTGENLSYKVASQILEDKKSQGEIATSTKIDDQLILKEMTILQDKGFDFKKLDNLGKEGKDIAAIVQTVRDTPSKSVGGVSAISMQIQSNKERE